MFVTYEILHFSTKEDALRAYIVLLLQFPVKKIKHLNYEMIDKKTEMPKVVFKVEVVPGETDDQDEFHSIGVELFETIYSLFRNKNFIGAKQ